jgi:hypothetical protein
VALGEGGKARSGMAVDSADVNQERFTNLPIDRYITLREGEAKYE